MKQLSLNPVTKQETEELVRYVKAYYRYDNLIYNVAVENAIHVLVTDNSLGDVWLIEVDGIQAGYAILTAGFDIEFGGKVGVLTDFYFEEDYRGKGYGSRTLRLIEKKAIERGYNAIELVVTHKNVRAKRLYGSFGFEPMEDRSSMLKELTIKS